MAMAIYVPKIDLGLMIDSIPYILTGLPYTIGISISTFILGNVLGIVLAVLGLLPSRILKGSIQFYLSFLRGVPGLVLLFLLYFGLPIQLSALQAVIICFSLTSSAFLGEIYRGAILGVGTGQWEAARALGLNFPQIISTIILPQAFRIAIPALGNVAMDLVKGTSLAAMITVPEIFQKAKIIGGREFDYMTLYILVALMYWGLCLLISAGQKRLEKSYVNRQ